MKTLSISKFAKKYNLSIKQLIMYLLENEMIKPIDTIFEVIDHKYITERDGESTILLYENKMKKKLVKENMLERLKISDANAETIMDIENPEEKLRRIKRASSKTLMFLDFEMGIHGIYEIGFVITKNEEIVEKGYYFLYDNPMTQSQKIKNKQKNINKQNIYYLTISTHTFKRILLDKLKTIQYIVAHNANNERKMINDLFDDNLVAKKDVICTANISKLIYGAERSLIDITQDLGVSNHTPHFALSDAEATQKIFTIFADYTIEDIN